MKSMRSATNRDLKEQEEFDRRRRKKKKYKQWHKFDKRSKDRPKKVPPPSHVELVRDLKEQNMLPALLFLFSRRDCQRKAMELAGVFNFGNPVGRKMANELFHELIDPELRDLESVQLVKHVVDRGIGVHHAGLLPGLKLMVEKLFANGHLKALYATETFALGVNMPARTVSFLNIRKYDGFSNRYLYSNEYHQCSGRAGRRGIDELGYVVTLMPRKKYDINAYETMNSSALQPIISQFTLSYNTVINMVKNHSPDEREQILRSSFDYYIRRKKKKHMWVMRRYKQFLRTLNKLGYLSGEQVTDKGEFASKIYTHEILVTEIFATGLYKRLNSVALAILLTAIMYEERRNDHFKFDTEYNSYEVISKTISRNAVVAGEINLMSLKRMCLTVRLWCMGSEFTDLLEITNIEEGDLIHIFRNTLDLARQIMRASDDADVKERMEEIIEMIDRDVISVSF
jgi:superfamily II RNA helicase